MTITIDDFARHAVVNAPLQKTSVMRAAGQVDLANSNGRIIRYLFSDPSVARDNHTIAAWTLDNYLRNPVFLWAHDLSQPPIGRVVDLAQRDGVLSGSVEYMDREIYPFADTIFQMVKEGYLNATSVSWDPVKWRLANDRSRPGGVDFELVDLMEISQVPVPSLPTALATARANGIDTSPIFDWAGRILDEGGMMMMVRADVEDLRRAARMPSPGRRSAGKTLYVSRPVMNHAEIRSWMRDQGFASSLPGEDMHVTVAYSREAFDWTKLAPASDDLVVDADANRTVAPLGDGGAVVLRFENAALAARWQEIRDAGASWDFAEYHPHVTLSYRGLPDGVAAYDGQIVLGRERFEEISDGWSDALLETEFLPATTDQSRKAAMSINEFKRSMYHVSWLASVLCDLDCVQQDIDWEKQYREKDTLIPDELLVVKAALGNVLVQLVGEEVAAMLGPDDEGDDAATSRARAVSLLRQRAGASLSRSGKMLSADNAAMLNEAHDMIDRGCGMIRGLLEKNAPDADDVADPEEGERAMRLRRAAAMKLRIAVAETA
ncbi:hypothetical protein [Rhizobium sp. SGZ-381]|uniref:hypothetical protein n=1 Tax=Rhizobium sp. SGZ-381 TaxID=3342800 RepID=UPI0036721F23